MLNKKEEYISLRDAAKMSGYSPDYVGQLIRSGKLPGKQVFSHVAWMTTEDALQEYMQKKRGGKTPSSWQDTAADAIRSIPHRVRRQFEMPKLFTKALYGVVILSVCFLLLLFYIFSTSLERELNQKAIQKAQTAKTL